MLLNEIKILAKRNDYHRIEAEVHEGKPFAAVITAELRKLLYDLDRMEGAKESMRKAWAVFAGFVNTVKVGHPDTAFTFSLDISPAQGALTLVI